LTLIIAAAVINMLNAALLSKNCEKPSKPCLNRNSNISTHYKYTIHIQKYRYRPGMTKEVLYAQQYQAPCLLIHWDAKNMTIQMTSWNEHNSRND